MNNLYLIKYCYVNHKGYITKSIRRLHIISEEEYIDFSSDFYISPEDIILPDSSSRYLKHENSVPTELVNNWSSFRSSTVDSELTILTDHLVSDDSKYILELIGKSELKIPNDVKVKEVKRDLEYYHTNVKKEEDIFYTITLNERFLFQAEEHLDVNKESEDSFNSRKEYLDYILNTFTVSLDIVNLQDIKNQTFEDDNLDDNSIQIYYDGQGLDKYTLGEHIYWHSDYSPKSISEILEHFKTLFPEFDVRLQKHTTQTKSIIKKYIEDID